MDKKEPVPNYEDILRNHGISPTPVHMTLLWLMHKHVGDKFTSQELFEIVEREMLPITESTISSTVNLFRASGLIHCREINTSEESEKSIEKLEENLICILKNSSLS